MSFYAEDPLVTSDEGALFKPDAITREWTDAPRLGITYKGSDVLDLRVHTFGEFAVANFRLDLDEDWGGQKLFGAVRITDVFVHRAGRWLLVRHQETPLPNARRVAAKIDTAILGAYAGEYRITPSFLVNVKREGDKLFDLWPGESKFTEEIPVSSTTFVARGDSGEVIYEQDPGGKVTHFIFRTPSGDPIAEKNR